MILMPSGMRILLYSGNPAIQLEKFKVAIELDIHRRLLPHPHSHAPMEESMSAADVPLGTSQFPSSMPSIDELLRQYEARSAWKLISMPNLTALCHEHKCDKCSTYLEHLLIANRAGELCACPEGIEARLDHAWPATMNNICREVGEPLAKKT